MILNKDLITDDSPKNNTMSSSRKYKLKLWASG